jgi:hypothetical protein
MTNWKGDFAVKHFIPNGARSGSPSNASSARKASIAMARHAARMVMSLAVGNPCLGSLVAFLKMNGKGRSTGRDNLWTDPKTLSTLVDPIVGAGALGRVNRRPLEMTSLACTLGKSVQNLARRQEKSFTTKRSPIVSGQHGPDPREERISPRRGSESCTVTVTIRAARGKRGEETNDKPGADVPLHKAGTGAGPG